MTNKFKSKWEAAVADQIKSLGFPVNYERFRMSYVIPESIHQYTPDFYIKDKKYGEVYLEAKGKFVYQDRKKHLLLKEQFPDLNLVIVFQNANQRISKKSKTTYAMWCDKNGIKWVHKTVNKDAFKKRNCKQ